MHNWIPFPFLRITFFYILGIICCVYLNISITKEILIITAISSFIVYITLIFLVKKNLFISLNLIVSSALFWLIFVIGYSITWFNTPSNSEQHFLHKQEIQAYSAVVKQQPVLKTKSERILVDIEEIKTDEGWQKGIGKLFLYVKRDSIGSSIEYGQKLLVIGNPNEIEKPKNPNEFNYKEYIGFQGIYFNHFINSKEYKIVGEGYGSEIMAYSIAARNWCEQVLGRYINTTRERAIALALIIGVKDEISKDINSAYASAGAMHVLAVSGLHVGVIYWILSLLLNPFKKNKYGKWIFLLIALIGLWGYAFITGLSASVLRAVTMFSFVTIASVTDRQSNIYNTLAISAFVLLCYNPYLIMSVGFQLSYLAVFGIVYLQPKIYNLWFIQNKILDQIWVITSVSIAAQIATAPLVVLYFHQLPSYFFISNLFVIPGAFIILCIGLLLFAVSWIPMLNEWIGWVLQKVIWIINELVFTIQKIPYNTIDNIYLTTFQTWCVILTIMFLLGVFRFRKFTWIVAATLPVIGFSITSISLANDNIKNTEIVFYAVNNAVAIDFIQGDEAYLYADSLLLADENKLKFHIAPYRLKRSIPIDYNQVNNEINRPTSKQLDGFELISWNGKLIAVVSPNFKSDFKDKLTVDYLYITKLHKKVYHNVKKNFEYQNLILKPYKSIPNYIDGLEKVHDLTNAGVLQIKL